MIDSPSKVWHIDLSGPHRYVDASGRERQYYVLVQVESFTRWVELAIIPYKDPDSVAFGVYTSILCRHGIPDVIVSDRGSEFADTFHDACVRFQIAHIRTSAYNPRANGKAESQVGRLGRQLKRLAGEHPSAWPRLVPRVQFSMNTAVNTATKFTPFELVYGRPPAATQDLSRFLAPAAEPTDAHFPFGVHALEAHTPAECEEALHRLRHKLFRDEGQAFNNAQHAQQLALQRAHRQWERRTHRLTSRAPEKPTAGDAVILITPPTLVGTNKQAAAGPFFLQEVKGSTAVLRSGSNRTTDSKTWTCNYDRLVKYYFE